MMPKRLLQLVLISLGIFSLRSSAVYAQIHIAVTQENLIGPTDCTNAFVAHDLDHITAASGTDVHLYQSNGAGVAIGDLDGDSKLDIVLANLNGKNTILWNQGSFSFRKKILADVPSRGVNIVDVDGDGWPDIVFTHSISAPTYWHSSGAKNSGAVEFTQQALVGVLYRVYSMAWANVHGGDGALDLVTGSYDADLELTLGNSFMFSNGAGIFYYQQHSGSFTATRLAEKSQALTLLLQDLRGDGKMTLLVGNDFASGNPAWQYTPKGWVKAKPFAVMTSDTMSLDTGDINNDGYLDLIATDMKALPNEPLDAWKPVLSRIKLPADKSLVLQNVLQIQRSDGTYADQAEAFGIDATGWSWAAQLGDLDNDGLLDLYVVNGMNAIELFPKLPKHELVEENQAFRNDGGKRFVLTPEWKLNSTSGGRGMVMADLNNDGKLDIVVNNLGSPAQLFDNQLCAGSSLEVDLRWLTSLNTRAIGAKLKLTTSTGTYYRDVRVSSGYLSSSPSRVHFGLPANSHLLSLDIRWPDGETTGLGKLTPDTLVTLTRS